MLTLLPAPITTMTKDHMKATLACYREHSVDENFPHFREALAQLDKHSDVAEWFECEKARDEDFSGALNEIEIPEGLEESILRFANREESDGVESGRVIRPALAMWKRTAWMSAAALIIVAASLVKYFAFPPPVVFDRTEFSHVDAFREDMGYFASQRFVLDHTTKDLSNAKMWLEERGHPVYAKTPDAIVNYRGMGCKSFQWGDHHVSLVCFEKDNKELVHLFVIEREGLDGSIHEAEDLSRMLVKHERETGGWYDDEHVYVLVGSEPGVEIGEILREI